MQTHCSQTDSLDECLNDASKACHKICVYHDLELLVKQLQTDPNTSHHTY